VETTQRTLEQTIEKRVKHVFELHSKFSLAAACLIFLFIGAPMGAIIRKGGFGYPILISILFFMVFIILTIMCKKLAESNSIVPALAAWIPCIVLFPIGMVLTTKAMNDSKMLNADRWLPLIQEGISKLRNFNKKETSIETNH
jgi:lipopolysaccharide export system permease protein